MNDWEPTFNEEALVEVVLAVASGGLSKRLIEVFESRCKPSENTRRLYGGQFRPERLLETMVFGELQNLRDSVWLNHRRDGNRSSMPLSR